MHPLIPSPLTCAWQTTITTKSLKKACPRLRDLTRGSQDAVSRNLLQTLVRYSVLDYEERISMQLFLWYCDNVNRKRSALGFIRWLCDYDMTDRCWCSLFKESNFVNNAVCRGVIIRYHLVLRIQSVLIARLHGLLESCCGSLPESFCGSLPGRLAILQRGVNLFELFAKHQPGVAGCDWLQPGRNFLST